MRSQLYDVQDECESKANEIILDGQDKLKTIYFAMLSQLEQQLEIKRFWICNNLQ